MNILFFVLNLIILLFKQTNCVFILNNISPINELNEFSLFTEYNLNHFLRATENSIYLISPFEADKKVTYTSHFTESTNIKYLGEELFALICLKENLISIYNIEGEMKSNFPYESTYNLEDISKCAVEYENNKFYISYLSNVSENLNIIYTTVIYKDNKFNENKTIQINFNLANHLKYNIFNFNNEIKNFIIINEYYEDIMGQVTNENEIEMKNIFILNKKLENDNFELLLNLPIENVEIIDGFKLDENNFIIYGLIDNDNITIININFNTNN